MDNIKKNYKKLNNVISYINNKYYIGKLYLLIDILFCKIKYKANLNDYKMFSMYLLNNKERKTILTSGKNLILTNKLNDYSKLHIFENKNEFNEVFGDYLKRKWMFINRKNYNEFECFIKNMDYIIAKPNDNTEGKRIEKIKVGDYSIKELYNYLKDKDLLLVEEVIKQHNYLNKLYSKSINRVTVVTILYNDITYIISINLNLGNNSIVDSLKRGGMTNKIDIETGTSLHPFCDRGLNNYYFHPVTKEKINNIKLPYINEIKSLVKDLSKIIKTVRYVSWDIAITNDGPILIGASPLPNIYYQFYVHNEDNKGIMPLIDEILNKETPVDSIEIKKDDKLSISN
ncbi:MAG: sugar-transfer associated ATP-grasp domain-containing protein [Bacilli bacterium]|nr:hypothetical protein [Mycoplasmatota bacterium]MDY4237140.1 sugar-transfer associated ATP-grasp domain-containing protein [Bacilli bacterium]